MQEIEHRRLVEYTYRKVERFVVTRYHSEELPNGCGMGGVDTYGEFDNWSQARFVAQMLARAEDGATFREPTTQLTSS